MASERDMLGDLFAQLYEGLKEEPCADLVAMRRSLEDEGVDVDMVLAKGVRLVAEFKKRQRLTRARQKLARLQRVIGGWAGSAEQSADRLREDIARALGGEGAAYHAYHRKLSRVDSEDLKSLHDDAGLLMVFIARLEADDTE